MIYKESFDIAELTLELYTPDAASQIIYLFDIPEEINLPYDLLEETETACVIISDPSSDQNLSLFSSGDPDNERAHAFLAKLYYDIIPEAEDMLSEIAICPEYFEKSRMIFGMNDASLFSLYAAYRTDLFVSAASLNPDLTNEDFMDFARRFAIYKGIRKVALLTKEESPVRDFADLMTKQEKECLIYPVKASYQDNPELLTSLAIRLLLSMN